TLVLGVQNDFECAFSDYILATGLWTGVFQDASTWLTPGNWSTRRPPGSGGTCTSTLFRGGSFAPYTMLHIARVQGQTVYDVILEHPDDLPNKQQLLATAAAYEGYATVLLGEGWCEMRFEPLPAPVHSRAEVFELAAGR